MFRNHSPMVSGRACKSARIELLDAVRSVSLVCLTAIASPFPAALLVTASFVLRCCGRCGGRGGTPPVLALSSFSIQLLRTASRAA